MTQRAETSAPQRTRLSPEARRECILAAARRCCIRSGAFALSLAEVAQEAGISRNLVYHYFPNRAALLSALLDAEGQVLGERAAAIAPLPGESPRDTLRRLICAFLDFTAERSDGFSLLSGEPSAKPLLREQFAACQALLSRRIFSLLELPDVPAAHAALEAATGFLMRFAYIERAELSSRREAAADLCLGVLLAAADGARRYAASSDDAAAGSNGGEVNLPSEGL